MPDEKVGEIIAVYTVPGSPGTYGTQGVAAVGNVAGGRNGASSWIDNEGNLWLFGGAGFPYSPTPQTNTASLGPLNDLWKFTL
jgi:hypothetical protein